MSTAPKPFTRLPVSDLQGAERAINDLYDKLAIVGSRRDGTGQAAAPAQQFRTTGVRQVQSSTAVLASDLTVVANITIDAVLILPDAKQNPGKVFHLKNSATSDADFTLGTENLTQLVDNADPGSFVQTPGDCITVQSTGREWIVLGLYDV